MMTSVSSKSIGSLDDLEQAAKASAEQLGKASSRNAIWDKATKSLKPGLTGLTKVRSDAEAEAALAEQLYASLIASYDSAASDLVRSIRTKVDNDIALLATA